MENNYLSIVKDQGRKLRNLNIKANFTLSNGKSIGLFKSFLYLFQRKCI